MESSAINAAGPASRADVSFASLTDNFDAFLTLLTKQLQNQDPLSPMDTNEFTNQLVQFSGVEQAIQTNKHLEQLVTTEANNQVIGALQFIGKEIEAASDSAVLGADGATFHINVPANTAALDYTITDVAGNPLFNGAFDPTPGRHQIVWDGRGDDGQIHPPGDYRIQVSGVDAQGAPSGVTTGLAGIVTGIETRDGQAVALIDDAAVRLDQITAVRDAP